MLEYCPHAAGPPQCWCRKPLPGLGVSLTHRQHLDPTACIYVGDGLARRWLRGIDWGFMTAAPETFSRIAAIFMKTTRRANPWRYFRVAINGRNFQLLWEDKGWDALDRSEPGSTPPCTSGPEMPGKPKCGP